MSEEDTIQISCKEVASKKTFGFQVKLEDTILEIKKQLHKKYNSSDQNFSEFNPKIVEFTFQGDILVDEQTLRQCKIENGDVIIVVISVIGGLFL